jgi:ubiquinone/menaquinone biosynthesis C-methylase UbiE
VDELREKVKQKYSMAISTTTSCCGGSCCSSVGASDPITTGLYADDQLGDWDKDFMASSFGCGNPTALTELRQGETVLDLGSGAGLDVMLTAKRVGPTGKVYGLDMTDEMLAAARENQKKYRITNVEFIKGYIEDIPLPADSIDVVLSNCVINLSGDKDRVIQEAYRVLRKGGRFAVSDILVNKSLPEIYKKDLEQWSGCVAGALSGEEYQHKLIAAGFVDIKIEITREYNLKDLQESGLLQKMTDKEIESLNGCIVSAFVTAKKTNEEISFTEIIVK